MGRFHVSTFLIAIVLVFVGSPLMAVQTPYTNQPTGFSTHSEIIWDTQLSSMFANVQAKKADIIFIPGDVCHSGGLLNEVNFAKYGASACSWDEHGYDNTWSVKLWGHLGDGDSFADAFLHTYADIWQKDTPWKVSDWEFPQQMNNGGGGWNANHRVGDRAILFNGSSENRFKDSVNTAYTTLTTKMTTNWNATDIDRIVENGTKAQLQTALNNAAEKLSEGQRLIVFLNDHGCSTDVIKSRHIGNRYSYETNVSIWRKDDYDTTVDDCPRVYGITDVYTEVVSTTGYSNWQEITENWTHDFVEKDLGFGLGKKKYINWHAIDRDNPDQWLRSEISYSFGYDHAGAPMKVSWANERYGGNKKADGTLNATSMGVHDFGWNDGSPWGRGCQVWLQPTLGALDTAQWAGWDNGGDGWIWTPVPEPASLILLALGSFILLLRRCC